MKFARLLPALCLALALPRVARADLGYDKSKGGFVTSLVRSGNELWSGTEDQGVGHFQNGKWTHFTTKDGLGDNDAYALATDRLGRVWVGHLNHGVSVWNGKTWKNYGVTEGPLGERVFALATSPIDGDVWIAHNAGLTRYSLKNNNWTHYTRATGLPTIEISSLAFDALGRLWVGTQHDGLLQGNPDDDFGNWRHITGATTLPLTPEGEGLPSNWINDVLITPEDKIFVATNTGLAQSNDYGESWTFLRGRDWLEKARGLWKGPKVEAPEVQIKELLAEDYVTNLAQDDLGLLWIGYRRAGYEIRRPLVDRAPFLYPEDKGENFPYVSSIVPLGDGTAALGFYNDGVKQSIVVPPFAATPAEREALARRNPPENAAMRATNAPFPAAASAPSMDELNHLLQLLKSRQVTPKDAPPIAVLPDDWTTQGDWLGRYGRYWADLCAMISPKDLIWGAQPQPIEYKWNLGPNSTDDDSTRYWIHWLQTDNRRALEQPPMYGDSRLVKGYAENEKLLRRQSEVDDHGEAYPLTQDGPHLRCVLKVPEGNWMLSLYNHNKDGHGGFNRARDYKISIRPHNPQFALSDTSDFTEQPEFAQARQRDFWGGDWKRFYVRGPQELTIEINRNYSFNTIMAGVFLDSLDEEPYPYFNLTAGLNPETNTAKARTATLSVDLPENEAAEALWAQLEQVRREDPQWWLCYSRPFYARLCSYYEKAKPRTTSEQLDNLWVRLGTCYHALNQMEQWENTQGRRGLVTAREIEHSIRWDGRWDDRGAGFEAVVAYSTAKAGLNWWEKNKGASLINTTKDKP